jgi:hypothetical protein
MADRGYAADVVRNTLVVVWNGDPTIGRLEVTFARLVDLSKRYPDGVFMYNVILPSTGMPGSDARKLLQHQFESMRGALKGAVVVLEKSGIEGTLSRTIISTLLVLSRKPFAMKVFGLRREASEWLASHGNSHDGELWIARAAALTGQLETEANRSATRFAP